MHRFNLIVSGTNSSTSADEYTLVDHTYLVNDNKAVIEGFINCTTTQGKLNFSNFSGATATQCFFQNIGLVTVTISYRDYLSNVRSHSLAAGAQCALCNIKGLVADNCITILSASSEALVKYIIIGDNA